MLISMAMFGSCWRWNIKGYIRNPLEVCTCGVKLAVVSAVNLSIIGFDDKRS